MDIKNFLETICNEIKYKPVIVEISQEIESHIKEIKEDYMDCGMKEQEAEQKAIEQMGNAEEIGKELNKIHKPKLDWKLLTLLVILIGFGTLYIIQSIANILMNINMGVKTSVILPFVSDADIYYVINILCMAVIFSIYRRKDINLYESKSKSAQLIEINDLYKEEI